MTGTGAGWTLPFRTIYEVVLMLDREQTGRYASPTAAVMESQAVEVPGAGARDYAAGKRIVSRKRHIAVDTNGRLLMVNLTSADLLDSASAQMILCAICALGVDQHLFADKAYDLP